MPDDEVPPGPEPTAQERANTVTIEAGALQRQAQGAPEALHGWAPPA